MHITARNNTTRLVSFIIGGLILLIFILAAAVTRQAFTNNDLIHKRQTIVTPMQFNAPFTVSETRADTEYLRMMTLSFLALRLNVSPETVDLNHEFLLSYVRTASVPDFVPVLDDESKRIKDNGVNSAFYQTDITVYPANGRVDARGVLKTWIGTARPETEIKQYRLDLEYDNGLTRIARFVEVTNEK
ncbi:type IV conjugative transfer system protein TraE [Enterobacter huaxiensis]|uniref:type IV conjugative transfer system protein TraE n=1 Tax=Enterobacter huaxiensis TaxID=2494702 RepID=UPI002175AFAB|nr:type IV conjugative transfer system protein TraE [Enterobacter huaxiensis]MCS5452319.1 type IV conjugative transfer system protein TraE [Enterobacter huaxiensis]